jgi:hypothetical protein
LRWRRREAKVLFCAPKENQKWFSRLRRRMERFFIKANCSLLMSKENQKSTRYFRGAGGTNQGLLALDNPEGVVETQKC